MLQGAQKAYEFGIAYPSFVRSIIPIVGSVKTNPYTHFILENTKHIITSSHGWNNGEYTENPVASVHAALLSMVPHWLGSSWWHHHASNRSLESAQRTFWNNLFLEVIPQDARSIVYQLTAWAEYNIADRSPFHGDVVAALSSIRARTLILSAKYDTLITDEEFTLPATYIPNAKRIDYDSDAGHLICCGFDPTTTNKMQQAIRAFLKEL